jgi:MFS family permease
MVNDSVPRKNKDFLRYWVGQAASNLGSSASIVAYPLIVLGLGGSPAQAGIVASCSLITQTVCRLPAGYVVDRFSRRNLMLAADAVRAVALASIPVAAALGALGYPILVVVALIEGVATAVFAPVSTIALRRLVPEDQLTKALARNQAQQAGVYLLGPVLGGWLYTLDPLAPFLADAATYALSGLLILRIRTPLDQRTPASQTDRRMSAGVRWLVRRRALCAALGYAGVLNLVGAASQLAVIVSLQARGVGGTAIGLVLACGGGGAVLGTAAAAAIIKRMRPAILILAVGVVWSAALGIFAVAPSQWVIAPLLTGLFLLAPSAGIVVGTAILTQTPDEIQGRVSTAAGMLMSGLPAVGPVLAGAVLGAAGVGGGWLVLASVTAVATAAAAVPLLGRPDLDDRVGVRTVSDREVAA